jgi:SAM-dependent methyltransferase
MFDFPHEVGRHALIEMIQAISSDQTFLEIGPFTNPILTGRNIKYFDVLSREELIERASVFGLDISRCVDIDFVSPFGDLSIVEESFDYCLSSHCIEHQPDLIAHFRHVARILRSGGRYILLVPDKRYCMDHFHPETTIADILDAQGRTAHSLRTLIMNRTLEAHNDAVRHWAGDHGGPALNDNPNLIAQALKEHQNAKGGYIDLHAWQFTPESFRRVVGMLRDLELIQLRIERLYPPLPNSNEFCAILTKDE